MMSSKIILASDDERIDPKYFSNVLSTYNIGLFVLVPSLLNILLSENTFIKSSIKYLIMGGEKLNITLINKLKILLPKTLIFNVYGPTETTIMSLFYLFLSNEKKSPIGSNFDYDIVALLNKYLQQSVPLIENELFISGLKVGKGYNNRTKKTATASLPDILSNFISERMYATGDICYIDERCEIVYIDRKDFQTKRNGQRIELEEIQSFFLQSPFNLTNVEVILFENNILLAYYIKNESNATFSEQEILDYAITRLESHKVPNAIFGLKEFPYTSTGKLDRKM